MASTITNINWAKVDQKVNAALRYGLPARDLFSVRVLGLEDGTAKKGDKVWVPFATDPTKAVKTLGSKGTATGTLAGVAVTLDYPIEASWDATEGNMGPAEFRDYWEDKIAGGMYVLSKDVVDAGLALVTATNYGNTEGTDKLTVAPADFGQSDMGLLWTYGAKKIKQRSRSLLLNAEYAGQIIGNTQLATVLLQGGSDMVKTGVLPQLIGHNTAAYPDLPANSENLGGAVFGQAAICLACAPIAALAGAGDGDIVDRRIITHADTGLSALYTMTVDGGGTIHGEVTLMYGVAKGQNSVVRLVSANA
jgi:hypothetical protein